MVKLLLPTLVLELHISTAESTMLDPKVPVLFKTASVSKHSSQFLALIQLYQSFLDIFTCCGIPVGDPSSSSCTRQQKLSKRHLQNPAPKQQHLKIQYKSLLKFFNSCPLFVKKVQTTFPSGRNTWESSLLNKASSSLESFIALTMAVQLKQYNSPRSMDAVILVKRCFIPLSLFPYRMGNNSYQYKGA